MYTYSPSDNNLTHHQNTKIKIDKSKVVTHIAALIIKLTCNTSNMSCESKHLTTSTELREAQHDVHTSR